MVAMIVEIATSRRLSFDDGSPVRAASGIARLGDAWLVVQDDATHVAHYTEQSITALRVFDAVDGHDVFSEARGTKHLKPDLEAACELDVDGRPAVLVLGSGSTARRMRGALVTMTDAGPHVAVADLGSLYERARRQLDVANADVNFEGACCVDGSLRWFNRGNPGAGAPSASVDIDLADLVDVFRRGRSAGSVRVSMPRRYDLGRVGGVDLTVTDAVALPCGRVLVCGAAEDTPNTIDDGPVVGSVLAVLDGESVERIAPIPRVDRDVAKVEGLALIHHGERRSRVLAVVDSDDPGAASFLLELRIDWSPDRADGIEGANRHEACE